MKSLSPLAQLFATGPACPGFLAAADTPPPKMNVIILDLKLVRFGIGQGQAVQARVFHINDPSANQADKVMMLADLGIETRRRAGMAGSRHQAQRHERAEDAMDGHSGDLRQVAANLAVELLSRRVIAAVKDRRKNGAPLSRDRQAAVAMRCEEAVRSLYFVG